MEHSRSDYDLFSGNRSQSSRCWWFAESVSKRDVGYCLALVVVGIALVSLISANGHKTTLIGELEGRIGALEKKNSSANNVTDNSAGIPDEPFLREHPLMMSAKISDFLTPSPT